MRGEYAESEETTYWLRENVNKKEEWKRKKTKKWKSERRWRKETVEKRWKRKIEVKRRDVKEGRWKK